MDKRQDDVLLLNPRGPWWFAGSQVHADFLELCNGERSVREIHQLLSPRYATLKIDSLVGLLRTLFRIQFFSTTEKAPLRPCEVVHFYVTKRCNLECPFCYYDAGPSKSGPTATRLQNDTWIRVAREIAAINPEANLSVSGGEPLLEPDIVELLEGIAANDLGVRLITNGTLMSDALVARLSDIPKLSVQVSIDSLVPEENAKTRGRGSLETAVAAVHRMLEAGIRVGITSTVTQINKNSTWRTKQFCDRHKMDFGTSFFFKSGDRSQENAEWLTLTPSEIVESSVLNSDHYEGKQGDLRPSPGRGRDHCGIGHGQLSIHADGAVSPCRLLLDPQFYLGNVLRSSLVDILSHGRRTYDFLGVDRVSCGCASCEVRYLCVGGCKAASYYSHGELDRLPPNCTLLRKIFKENLWTDVLGSTANALENLRDLDQVPPKLRESST